MLVDRGARSAYSSMLRGFAACRERDQRHSQRHCLVRLVHGLLGEILAEQRLE
jgi:hypothetical protein